MARMKPQASVIAVVMLPLHAGTAKKSRALTNTFVIPTLHAKILQEPRQRSFYNCKTVQVWYACNDQDEAVHFHDHDCSTTSVLGDGYEAGRANECGGNIAHARNGNAKTARGLSCSALAEEKMAIKPCVPGYTMDKVALTSLIWWCVSLGRNVLIVSNGSLVCGDTEYLPCKANYMFATRLAKL